MTQHEDLAAYYSRCRTLLFVKSEAYRLADEDAPEHTDEFYDTQTIQTILIRLKIRFGHGRRPWLMPTRTWPTSLWEDPSTEELPRTRRSETFSRPVGVGERVPEAEAAGAALLVRELRREGTIPPAAKVQRGQVLPIGIGRPPRREREVVPYRYGS